MTTKQIATTRSPNRGGAYFLRTGFGCSEAVGGGAVGGGEEESLAGKTAMSARQESIPKYFQVSETSKVLMKVGDTPSILRVFRFIRKVSRTNFKGFSSVPGSAIF